jgi:hypothetical protein
MLKEIVFSPSFTPPAPCPQLERTAHLLYHNYYYHGILSLLASVTTRNLNLTRVRLLYPLDFHPHIIVYFS